MKTHRFRNALLPLALFVACGDGAGGSGGSGGSGGAGGEGGGGGTPDACANVDELRATCEDLPERFDASTTLAQGCYRANTSPILGPNVTLTLAPGVTILFAEGTGLETNDTQAIVAAGSPELPICLTGDVAQRGSWNGVTLGRTEGDDHVFEHVVIEYGGGTDVDAENAGLKVVSDSREVRLGLSNTTIRESEGYGLYLVGSATLSAFGDNVFTTNTLGPASVDSEVAGVLDPTSTYVGNDVDEILVRSYVLTKNLTWAALGVPYHVDASLDVEGDWTLEAPNTLVMSEGAAITLSGDTASLKALGTADLPIVFTGAQKSRGYWDRLAFDGTNGDNELAFVIVEYAGSTTSDADGAGIKAVADSGGLTLSLTNVTVRESEGFGLWLAGSATVPAFSSNVFTANGLGPVSISSRRVHVLDLESAYDGNDVDRVRVRDDRVTESVTWPDLGLPYQLEQSLHVDLVWTLAPGVTLMMPEDGWISVDGDLAGFHAVGTEVDPITITGVDATAGHWHGLLFGNSLNPANSIQHAVIEYGGSTSGGGEAGMITASSDSHGVVISVRDSVVRQSGQWGIWLGGFAQYNGDIESSNTFADNAGGDVYFAD